MQAVILAGGLGTRLRPLTTLVPKPMAPVAGAPFLDHQLRLLQRNGVTDIVLLTGYLGEAIESYFGDGHTMKLSIRYSREATPIGTGGALREASHLLAPSFILAYGDSYLPIDYADLVDAFDRRKLLGLLVVYDNSLSDTSVNNNIAVGPDDVITRYDKHAHDADLQYVDAGVLVLDKAVLPYIPSEGTCSLERDVFPSLIAARSLHAYRTATRFYDIGNADRLTAFEEYLTHDHH